MTIKKGWKGERIRERYNSVLSRLEEEGIILEDTTFKLKKNDMPLLKLRSYEKVEKVLSLLQSVIKGG